MSETVKVDRFFMRKRAKKHKGFIHGMKEIMLSQGGLLCLVGFLLGRAAILYDVSPFAVAFLATVWLIYQKQLFLITISIALGACTHSMEQAVFVCLSLFIFVLMFNVMQKKRKVSFMMSFVLLSTICTRVFLYSLQGEIHVLHWLSLVVEGVLGAVLFVIFMQSIPLIARKKYRASIKSEELICIVILIASVLTGFIGWEIYTISIEHIFSRYIVLVFAFVGGVAIGSTVGVVAGLILSLANVANLYQMSLLAFSGLLGGLLKEGKKHGVSLGLFVGTLLVGMYGGVESLQATIVETTLAVILFYITPIKGLQWLSRSIPGTNEYSYEERKYLQKIRNITAQRVGQFSEVFEALSKSFIQSTEKPSDEEVIRETDYFLSSVTEKTCQRCFMKQRCWQSKFDETYKLMGTIKKEIVANGEIDRSTLTRFENHCVKSKKVLETISSEVSVLQANKHLKRQVSESKKIVADQLRGVSDVMDNFAREIVKEREHHEQQEIQIVRALKQMDVHIESIDIYQLEKGSIDIEMSVMFQNYHGEAAKLIAPVLTDILHETIIVKLEEVSPFPNGVSFLTFGSAKQFTVETGVATAAKGGGLISGDCYTTMEIGEGKYALAISDGMGNGVRAREESSETLRLLKQILQTGISEQVAIKSINSILSLRTTDEIFATLDLAIVNLHNAVVRFLKIGSSPSFIKRGKEVIQVEASNLPIGIIEHVELDSVNRTLKSGDILIMMSDGIYDGPKEIMNNDIWLQRKIAQLKTANPQTIADLLLEEVIRTEHGAIQDDMTVVVAKIDHVKPKWSSIPFLHEQAE